MTHISCKSHNHLKHKAYYVVNISLINLRSDSRFKISYHTNQRLENKGADRTARMCRLVRMQQSQVFSRRSPYFTSIFKLIYFVWYSKYLLIRVFKRSAHSRELYAFYFLVDTIFLAHNTLNKQRKVPPPTNSVL